MNEKKPLLRLDELVNHVNELMRLGKGDLGRLAHIKDTLQQNKTLYESDKEYLEKLSRQYLSDKLNVAETHYDQPNPNLFCSKCGQNLKSGTSFCLKCETPQEKQQSESFCKKCGNKVYGNTTCISCNQSINSSTKPKKKGQSKRKKIGISVGITILVFFIIMTVIPLSPNSNNSNNFKQNYYEIGDIIKLEGINIKVLSTTTSGTDFWNTSAGTFFHVYVEIENVGKSTNSFTPKQFVLIDGEGREFTNLYFFTNSDDAIWTSKAIQPNLPITKFVTFDVPFDPNLKYELKVINAGLVCLENC